jgi:hypothetical protein
VALGEEASFPEFQAGGSRGRDEKNPLPHKPPPGPIGHPAPNPNPVRPVPLSRPRRPAPSLAGAAPPLPPPTPPRPTPSPAGAVPPLHLPTPAPSRPHPFPRQRPGPAPARLRAPPPQRGEEGGRGGRIWHRLPPLLQLAWMRQRLLLRRWRRGGCEVDWRGVFLRRRVAR